MKKISIGKMAKRTRFFNQEEIRKILKLLRVMTMGNDYDRALVLFFLQTGCRIQEAWMLDGIKFSLNSRQFF